jgi:hypothetical protein
MVDAAGHVVATVFAAIVGSSSGDGGFAVPNALVRTQLRMAARNAAVSTGPCAG